MTKQGENVSAIFRISGRFPHHESRNVIINKSSLQITRVNINQKAQLEGTFMRMGELE